MRLLLLFGVIASALDYQVFNAPALHETWVETQEFPKERSMGVIVSMKERNLQKLSKRALAISTPGSELYGKFLKSKQLAKISQVGAAELKLVKKWLESANVALSKKSSSFYFDASFKQIEELFKTRIRFVKHTTSGEVRAIASDYKIPKLVARAISAVFGLHGLPAPMRMEDSFLPGEPAKVTPAVIYATYNIPDGTKGTKNPKNRQAVGEFQGQVSEESDQKEFFKRFTPFSEHGEYKIYKVVGSDQGRNAGVEASLDVQYLMGVAPEVLTEFWGFQNMDFCKDMKNFTDTIIDTDDAPDVFSISYGWQGNLTQVGCKGPEVDAIDQNFMKLAAKGVSFLISSGDSGSGYTTPPPKCDKVDKGVAYAGTGASQLAAVELDECCETASRHGFAGWTFTKRFLSNTCIGYKTVNSTVNKDDATSGMTAPGILWPSWPASSPWVTAVGATRFVGQKVGNPEMATDQFGSGGGFSAQFPREPNADWQTAAIQTFMTRAAAAGTLPPDSVFAKDGRGTPDVSALGEGFQVIAAGRVESVGGTSASAPTFAAIVALLNDARMAGGKAAMGFLNPFLYKNADAFTDVKIGTNSIGRGGQKLPYGFNCTEGWDPVTGLGTPIYDKLLKAAMDA